MQREVIEQLARAGHICGRAVPVSGSSLRMVVGGGPGFGMRKCVLDPGHRGGHSPDFGGRDHPDPMFRERVRRAKAVVAHERAERHVATLERQLAAARARRAWVEGFVGFRIEYRLRGGYRRARRYWRFVWHRTGGRRAWQRRASG